MNQTNRKYLVPIAAKVPAELAEAVAQLADAGDRSVSREIRRAIENHVERSAGNGSPVDPAELHHV